MKDDIKDTILKKGIKAIPNVIWVICASYALIVIVTVLALNFAHIDADKHINRYFEIKLSEQEGRNCKTNGSKGIIDKINQNTKDIVKLKLNSHKPN